MSSTLETLQTLDFLLVASVAVVCHDYIITFQREVELIWMKPWSTMSTLFVMLRYVGLGIAIVSAFWTNGVLYTPVLVGKVIPLVLLWINVIYLVVADVIMILRVSVMFAQPERMRRMRQVLFFLYAMVTTNTIVFVAVRYDPRSGYSVMPGSVNLEGGTLCQAQFAQSKIPSIYDGIPRGLFDVLLLALAVYCFVIHCVDTRGMLGRPKANKYMALLLEHSVLYFVLNFAYQALDAGTLVQSPPMSYLLFALFYKNSIPFMIYPRLVLNMRNQRAVSGGFLIGSECSGHPLWGYHKSPSVPVTESDEQELSQGTSTRVSQYTGTKSC